MPNTVDKVLVIAEAEVGYLEKKSNSQLDDKTANAGSNNYTKYWRDIAIGYQGQAWCNCFINWVFTKAFTEATAKKLLCSENGWSFYTPTSASYFKTRSQWHTSGAKVGDIIYFKNSTRIHHVGLVYKVDDTKVYTIEGNTSGGSSVIANGGGVCKKSYLKTNAAIAGYGRPNYDVEQAEATPSTFTEYKVKCTTNLNVRASASSSSSKVGILYTGHQFTIRGEENGWGKVCVISDSTKKTVNGWVSLRYCKKV